MRTLQYDPPVRHEHVHTLSCTTDVPIIVSLTIADLIDDGTDVIGVGAPMVAVWAVWRMVGAHRRDYVHTAHNLLKKSTCTSLNGLPHSFLILMADGATLLLHVTAVDDTQVLRQ